MRRTGVTLVLVALMGILQVALGGGRLLVAHASGGVFVQSIDSISVGSTCGTAGGFTGTVTLDAPWVGTVTLILSYSVPGGHGFVDTNPPVTATATFTGNTTAQYNFVAFTYPGANSYRINVYDAAGLLGSATKSNSVPACTGSTPPPPQCAGAGATGPTVLGLWMPGQYTDTSDDNSPSGSQITVGATSETVTSICAGIGPLDPNTANRSFSVAIYTDVSGAPDALVAHSAVGTLTTANGFNCLPISATLNANRAYWLMYNNNGDDTVNLTINNLTYNDASSQIGGYSNLVPQAVTTWTSPFPQFIGEFRQYAIYANVTP